MRLQVPLPLLLGATAALLAGCGTEPPPSNDPCEQINCPPSTYCRAGECVLDLVVIPTGDAGIKDGGVNPDGGEVPDGGEPPDGGELPDSGTPDAGTPDSGTPDSGTPDSGTPDSGTPDSGTPDAGTPDAGSATASQLIAAARATPDGSGLSLPIAGAVVTYLKPGVGIEGPGFTIQGAPQGPALYVGLDPASLSPSPSVGDVVAFTLTELATLGTNTVRMVAAIDPGSWTRQPGSIPVSTFAQDGSTADLVDLLEEYESEIVNAQVEVSGPFVGAGPLHVKAPIVTTAYPSGSPSLKVRVPQALRDGLDLDVGCLLTLQRTPVWRLGFEAQLAAWTTGDLTVNGCPAPKLLSAVSGGPTTVLLTFDRQLSPTTVTASGFSFSGGVSAVSASVSGKTVTLTTTPQAQGSSYTVFVLASVKDLQGNSVDPTANAATFANNPAPAVLLLNEVNPQVSSNLDLIELRAVSAGNTQNIQVLQSSNSGPQIVATLPSIQVAVGDLIVVHVNTPGGMSETTSRTQFPQASYPSHYDTAWDVAGTSVTLTYSHRVLTVVSAAGVITDGVAFVLSTTSSPPGAYPSWLFDLQAAGHWLPVSCGGGPCTYTSVPSALDVSADYAGVTSSPGTSVQRLSGQDTNSKNDWLPAGPSTFGLPN